MLYTHNILNHLIDEKTIYLINTIANIYIDKSIIYRLGSARLGSFHKNVNKIYEEMAIKLKITFYFLKI